VEAFGQQLAAGEIAVEQLETLFRDPLDTDRSEAALEDLGRHYVGRHGGGLLRIAAQYADERTDAQLARAVIAFTRAVLDAHTVCAHCQFPSVLPGLAALAALHANIGAFGVALLYYQQVITEAVAVIETAGAGAVPGLVKHRMIRPLTGVSGWDVIWKRRRTAQVVFWLGTRGTGGTIRDGFLSSRLIASSIVTFAEWFLADAQVESARIAEARGDLSMSFELLQSAEKIDRRIEEWNRLGITLNAMGRISRALGFHARQRHYYEAALPFHRRAGNKRGLGNALTNIALCHLDNPTASADDLAEALELVLKSLPIHRDSGNDDSEVIALYTLSRPIARVQKQLAEVPDGAARLREVLDRRGSDIVEAVKSDVNTTGSTGRSVLHRLRWCHASAALSAIRGDLHGQVDAITRYVAEFGSIFNSAFSLDELGSQLNELAEMLLDEADAAASLAERSSDRSDAVRALNFSERAKSRQLSRAVVQRRDRQYDTRRDELSETATEYREARARIAEAPTDFRVRESMGRNVVAMATTTEAVARDVAALHACLPPMGEDLIDGIFTGLSEMGEGLLVLGADVAKGSMHGPENFAPSDSWCLGGRVTPSFDWTYQRSFGPSLRDARRRTPMP
jgi:tetratricopeptide (TPR) repeat protein